MNEVLDACCLEVFRASRCACHNVEGAAVQILEGRDGVLSVLVVARADNNDVGTSSKGCVNAFLYGLEAEVVDDLITGGGQEVN